MNGLRFGATNASSWNCRPCLAKEPKALCSFDISMLAMFSWNDCLNSSKMVQSTRKIFGTNINIKSITIERKYDDDEKIFDEEEKRGLIPLV